jgi:hypothetical protein
LTPEDVGDINGFEDIKFNFQFDDYIVTNQSLL